MEEREQPLAQATQARALSLLGKLGREFSSVADLPILCQHLVGLLQEEAGYRSCALFLANGENRLALAASRGSPSQRQAEAIRLSDLGLDGGQGQGEGEGRHFGLEGQDSPLGSRLAIGLRAGERLIGAILVEDERPRAFTPGDAQVLEAVAPHLARALEVAQHYQKLQEAAIVDELTGVKNLRFFRLHLERELSRAQRSGFYLSLAILDVDRLKRVNDVFGHLAGDRVLKALAQLLRKSIRAYDEVARYGGDEFVLVLPEASPVVADGIMNRLVLTNDRARLDYLAQNIFMPAFSYGVATYPEDGQGAEQLFAVADQRLYQAKARKGIS